MKEIWKDVKGYEGLYQISNLGNVKRLEKMVIANAHGGIKVVPEMIRIPTDNGHGYKIVSLSKNKQRKNHYVHRLVAEHFLEIEKDKNYVNHIDYNKSNNCVLNLEWCTQKENVIHSLPNMKKPRVNSKLPKSGHKYIGKRTSKSGRTYYRVLIKNSLVYIEKYFDNIEEAIKFRDCFLKEVV